MEDIENMKNDIKKLREKFTKLQDEHDELKEDVDYHYRYPHYYTGNDTTIPLRRYKSELKCLNFGHCNFCGKRDVEIEVLENVSPPINDASKWRIKCNKCKVTVDVEIHKIDIIKRSRIKKINI